MTPFDQIKNYLKFKKKRKQAKTILVYLTQKKLYHEEDLEFLVLRYNAEVNKKTNNSNLHYLKNLKTKIDFVRLKILKLNNKINTLVKKYNIAEYELTPNEVEALNKYNKNNKKELEKSENKKEVEQNCSSL